MLRLMRHSGQSYNPITEIHCWIATFGDGHEEIVLCADKLRIGPSMIREPLLGKEGDIWDAFGTNHKERRPVSIRLASFQSFAP